MRVLAAALLLASAPALAEFQFAAGPAQARAFGVRTGIATRVTPSPGTALLGIPDRFSQHDAGARPRTENTLAISSAWYFAENWGLSLELGIPPVIEAQGYGTARAPGSNGAVFELDLADPAINPLASQRQWSPALALRHRFRDADARLRPFLALGVTRTWFTDVGLSPEFAAALDAEFGQPLATGAGKPGPTRSALALKSFWAPAVSGGLRWSLGSHWGLGAIAAWVPLRVESRLTMRASDGSRLSESRITTRADGVVAALLLDYRP